VALKISSMRVWCASWKRADLSTGYKQSSKDFWALPSSGNLPDVDSLKAKGVFDPFGFVHCLGMIWIVVSAPTKALLSLGYIGSFKKQ
jgi:hypothetical protein